MTLTSTRTISHRNLPFAPLGWGAGVILLAGCARGPISETKRVESVSPTQRPVQRVDETASAKRLHAPVTQGQLIVLQRPAVQHGSWRLARIVFSPGRVLCKPLQIPLVGTETVDGARFSRNATKVLITAARSRGDQPGVPTREIENDLWLYDTVTGQTRPLTSDHQGYSEGSWSYSDDYVKIHALGRYKTPETPPTLAGTGVFHLLIFDLATGDKWDAASRLQSSAWNPQKDVLAGVLLTAEPPFGHNQVHILDPRTRQSVRVADQTGEGFRWLSSGEGLLYTQEPGRGIYLYSLPRGSSTKVADYNGRVFFGPVSSDSRYVVCWMPDSAQLQLLDIRQHRLHVLASQANEYSAAWATTGQLIYIVKKGDTSANRNRAFLYAKASAVAAPTLLAQYAGEAEMLTEERFAKTAAFLRYPLSRTQSPEIYEIPRKQGVLSPRLVYRIPPRSVVLGSSFR